MHQNVEFPPESYKFLGLDSFNVSSPRNKSLLHVWQWPLMSVTSVLLYFTTTSTGLSTMLHCNNPPNSQRANHHVARSRTVCIYYLLTPRTVKISLKPWLQVK